MAKNLISQVFLHTITQVFGHFTFYNLVPSFSDKPHCCLEPGCTEFEHSICFYGFFLDSQHIISLILILTITMLYIINQFLFFSNQVLERSHGNKHWVQILYDLAPNNSGAHQKTMVPKWSNVKWPKIWVIECRKIREIKAACITAQFPHPLGNPVQITSKISPICHFWIGKICV